MTIEEIARLTDAKIAEGSIPVKIDNVTIDPEASEKGDLCFAEDEAAIREAAANGASAIVCNQFQVSSMQQDLCCLTVTDVSEAALKLAGHLASEESSAIEFLPSRELSYLKMILTQKKSIAFLPDGWKEAFEIVMSGTKPLIVTDNIAYYQALRPKKAPFAEKADGYVVSADSLFRTTFKIEKYIYQYRQFPHFHLPALQRAIALCQQYALPWRLDRLGYTRHFKPIFLEGEPSVQEVMKNDKVVILSDNLEDILKARAYASDVGNWMAKTIVMVPPKTRVEGVKYPTFYHSAEEVVEMIGSLHYNYLFIYTDDRSLEQRIKKEFL